MSDLDKWLELTVPDIQPWQKQLMVEMMKPKNRDKQYTICPPIVYRRIDWPKIFERLNVQR